MGGGGCRAKETALEISWPNGNIVNNLLPPALLLSQTQKKMEYTIQLAAESPSQDIGQSEWTSFDGHKP